MNRVAQHPLQGFLAALGAVAVLSVMDAVMKHLVLVIGIVAVSMWRSAANLALSAMLYLPRRKSWPDRKTLRVHVIRGIDVMVMAALFFCASGTRPIPQKNSAAMTITSIPRMTCTRRVLRSGQDLRRGK